ncbi:MAG: hypothetical protein ACK559_39935, partial [bacterium]
VLRILATFLPQGGQPFPHVVRKIRRIGGLHPPGQIPHPQQVGLERAGSRLYRGDSRLSSLGLESRLQLLQTLQKPGPPLSILPAVRSGIALGRCPGRLAGGTRLTLDR